MSKLIECHTAEEHRKSLADYYPHGPILGDKNIPGTDTFQFLLGIAQELVRSEAYLKTTQDEYIPNDTDVFLENWERALGIPDDCFKIEGVSLEQRKQNVLVKLSSLGVQTAQDFENLAAIYGLNVTVLSGEDAAGDDFPLSFPHTFGEDIPNPKFTIVVQYTGGSFFPLNFPHPFGTDAEAL